MYAHIQTYKTYVHTDTHKTHILIHIQRHTDITYRETQNTLMNIWSHK